MSKSTFYQPYINSVTYYYYIGEPYFYIQSIYVSASLRNVCNFMLPVIKYSAKIIIFDITI